MAKGATRRRVLRWLIGSALAVVLLVVMAAIAVELGLRTGPVRDALTGRISARVAESYGVGVEIGEFSLSLFAGSLEVRDFSLSASGSEPFVRVERIRAVWQPTMVWAWLVGGHLEVVELLVDRPAIDLGQQFPELVETDPSEPASELPFTIQRLRVTDATVEGAVPDALTRFLSSWSIPDADLEGSLNGSRFEVGSVTVELNAGLTETDALAMLGPEMANLEFHLAAEATGRLGGEIELRRATVKSEALEIEASGRVGSAVGDVSGSFRAQANPGVLLGGRATSEPVTVDGSIDVGGWKGDMRIRAPEIPGELLREFVGDNLFGKLKIDATTFALETDLELVETDGVTGEVRLVAERDAATVIRVLAKPRFRLGKPMLEAIPFDLDVTAELLPGLPGGRSVKAAIVGEELRRLQEWQVRQGDFVTDLPNVGALLAAVSRLWPQLLPGSALVGLPALGELSGAGSFSGALTDPVVDSSFTWRPHAGGVVTVRAAGHPGDSDLTVESEATNLSIGHFAAGVSGTLEWSGSVRGGLKSPSGGVHAAAWDLSGGGERLFENLDVRVTGDRKRLQWALDGTSSVFGQLEGSGSMVPERDLATGQGTLRLTPVGDMFDGSPANLIDLVEMSFELEAGSLVLSSRGFGAGGEILAVDGRLPLAAVARIPGAESLLTLPIQRSDGPIEAEWRIPRADWASMVPAAWRDRVGRLEGGSSGRVEFDTVCATCSAAWGEVFGFAAEVEGLSLAANEPLEFELVDGMLRLEPWTVNGEEFLFSVDGFVDLDKTWTLGSAARELIAGSGLNVDGEIGSVWLEELLGADGALLTVVTPGSSALHVSAASDREEWGGELTLSADDLVFMLAGLPELAFAAPSARVVLAGGEVRVEQVSSRVGTGSLTAEGRLRLDDPPGQGPPKEGQGIVRLEGALPMIDLLELPFEIRGGRLVVVDGHLATASGDGRIRFDLPLGKGAGTHATGSWELPAIDWAPLVTELSGIADPQQLVLASKGEVAADLDRLTQATVNATVSEMAIATRGRSTTLAAPMSLKVADGVMTLLPFTVVSGKEVFELAGRGELAADWRSGDPIAEMMTNFELDGRGALDSGLANPFLAGGRAEGPVEVDLRASGSPGDFSGSVRLSGPEASILYRTPYLARISEPEIRIVIEDGRITVEEATARLNNGPLSVSGIALEEDRTNLQIGFDKALFRLDYGLLATLAGRLRYVGDSDGTATLSGSVTVERGSLTRDVQLDFDLLTELLAPIDLSTTADDPLSLIALDMSVATREGVRVKNNLGDMLVRWEPIAVTGSLARPILKGEVEVDPGGLLYAYGQTVRLDRAVIEYPGGELDEPRLELEVTTSLEDPTIANLAGNDPFRSQSDVAATNEPEGSSLRGDLALYYGEQVASRLGESVGAKISLRPLLIFGEADPSARLTISQDFSSNFAVAASIDLTNVENRTYLLEAHELRAFPGFVGQGFTDDEAAYGGALLQRLEFGGSARSSDVDLPRLGRISFEPAPDASKRGLSKRGLKRALGLTKGDPFAPEDQFAAEVEVIDYLQAKGYPNASATLTSTPAGRRGQRLRLSLAVETGPHAAIEFVGEKIPAPLRRLIRSHYRTDFFEPESIETMRLETIRALRSRGFVSPEVQVRVEPDDPLEPMGDRRVLIETEGGARISPEAPIFEGVESEDLPMVAGSFFSAVQRVELAEGLPGADARLLRVLGDLGYPEATIARRFTSLQDRRLTVQVETGPRRTASSVEVASDDEMDIASLESLLAIKAGEPLRKNRLAVSALRLEQKLADDGFLDARVRTVIGESDSKDGLAVPVRFDIERGDAHLVEKVEFSGLRSTKESWVRRTAGIEEGKTLVRGDLPKARTALWRTGLFSSVGTQTEDLGGGRQRVVFDLAERDRFRLAYGIRWDSEDGASAVFDVTDENFLGRSWTLGLRALYSDDDKSARWLTRVPRVGGGKGSIEFFALARKLIERGEFTDIATDIVEATLQYSYPVGKRSTQRMYGRYRDTKLREVDPSPFNPIPLDERIKSPLLGWQFLYDSRGPEIFRERGLFFSLDLSGSGDFLGSDFRYARLFSQMNHYRGLGRLLGRPLSWAQSYRVGFAQAFDQDLLRSERFFAGGEYSVRGYGTESLGVQESLGSMVRPLGGESLLVVNQELHWRIFSDYELLAFGDIGNVWETSSDFGSSFFSSAGLGVRALTPIGLLRLDVARPLQRRDGIDAEFEVYFGLGTTF